MVVCVGQVTGWLGVGAEHCGWRSTIVSQWSPSWRDGHVKGCEGGGVCSGGWYVGKRVGE